MLTGKRIILRAPEREDLKLFHKWQNDEEVILRAPEREDLKLFHKWQNDEEVRRLLDPCPIM